MYARITPHRFSGEVRIPASKSHTIRRLIMASLSRGVSRIEKPLDSLDARSCVAACRLLGADIAEERDAAGGLVAYTVRGRSPAGLGGGAVSVDVGNSGTTLFLALATAALNSAPVTFTGDRQIARRSAGPLLDALSGLGVQVRSNRGCTPITVCGPWKGGRISLSCPTSQYLSALLIAAPLAPEGVVTEIDVPLLNEKPYVEMTLSYLNRQGLPENAAESANGQGRAGQVRFAPDFSRFRIHGGGAYSPVNGPVPGDFSSAAFPAAAAVISGGTPVTLLGLDPEDTQGDKVFFDYLVSMGCEVRWEEACGEKRAVISSSGPLRGGVFDLNAAPDMLPVMAALASYAEGETAFVNVAHARIKETDRIAVMAADLGKLGIACREKADGLIVKGRVTSTGEPANASGSTAGTAKHLTHPSTGSILHTILAVKPLLLDGHGDHRIVMALACAALGASCPVEIAGAEAADVTYPGFLELLGAG
jgi:3-phosphoshikimate 1-carboxyvinyltransferase